MNLFRWALLLFLGTTLGSLNILSGGLPTGQMMCLAAVVAIALLASEVWFSQLISALVLLSSWWVAWLWLPPIFGLTMPDMGSIYRVWNFGLLWQAPLWVHGVVAFTILTGSSTYFILGGELSRRFPTIAHWGMLLSGWALIVYAGTVTPAPQLGGTVTAAGTSGFPWAVAIAGYTLFFIGGLLYLLQVYRRQHGKVF